MSLNTENAILSNAIKVDSSYNVGIGGAATAGISLKNTKNLTGASTTFANYANGQIQTDATGLSHYFYSESNIAASTAATGIYHFKASQGTFGAGSSLTVQVGLVIDVSLSGAEYNYGIVSNINDATNNWNLYIGGTAKNWIASSLGIGAGLANPTATLDVNGTFKVSDAATFSSSVGVTSGFTDTINISQTSGSTTKGHLGIFADSFYISNNYFYNGAQSYDDTSKANSSIEMGTGVIYLKTGAANTVPSTKMTITSGGNVGIGTSTIADKLIVNGNIGITDGAFFTGESYSLYLGDKNAFINSTFGQKVKIGAYNGFEFGFGQNSDLTLSSTWMTITSGGNVGIGWVPTDEDVRLRVKGSDAGNAKYTYWGQNSNNTVLFYIRNDGFGYLANTAWSYGSDLRLKENIYDVENGIDMVLKMKPKHFDYIDGIKDNLGFIAQDIQEIIPQAVSVTDEKTGMLGLKTDFIVPYLVKAIQELNQTVQNQQQQINSLINR